MVDKPPCYILFVIPVKQGLQEVRAICTEAWIAKRMRDTIKDEPGILRCWVEKRDMNHMYGASMLDLVTSEQAKIIISRGIRAFETKETVLEEAGEGEEAGLTPEEFAGAQITSLWQQGFLSDTEYAAEMKALEKGGE